jgi:hypothetical protein
VEQPHYHLVRGTGIVEPRRMRETARETLLTMDNSELEAFDSHGYP